MNLKLLCLVLAIGYTAQQKIETISEEQLKQMIAAGEVEVVSSG